MSSISKQTSKNVDLFKTNPISKTKNNSNHKTINKILRLQQTIGNHAVHRLIQNSTIQPKLSINHSADSDNKVMRMPEYGIRRDYFEKISRQSEDETGQSKFGSKLYRAQAKMDAPPNKNRIPDTLKSGIENISGMSMDDVKVNYNSSKPVQLQDGPEEDEMQMKATPDLLQRQGPEKDLMRDSSIQTKLRRDQKEHVHKLPEERKSKVKGGVLARTIPETVVDVVGKGSALNAIVKSPIRTIKNVGKGLVSGFPSRFKMKRDAGIRAAMNISFGHGVADNAERARWITWNSGTGAFGTTAEIVGDWEGVDPGVQPADAPPTYTVGHYHTHPQLPAVNPGTGVAINPQDYPIGPSGADETFAQGANSPGLVEDFDTKARANETFYTYGPWTRT